MEPLNFNFEDMEKKTIQQLTINDVVYRISGYEVRPVEIKSMNREEINLDWAKFKMTPEDHTRFNFQVKDVTYYLNRIDALKALRAAIEKDLDRSQKKEDEQREHSRKLIKLIQNNDVEIAKQLTEL